MFDSVFQDFKYALRMGNMVTKIILVNVIVFVAINIIIFLDFNVGFSSVILDKLRFPSELSTLITQPWAFVTSIFLHTGFWHILWNMLIFYWFGRIAGDLIGDQHILPLYLLGGFAGCIFIIIWGNALGVPALALGASAAVMATVFAAATISPDYVMRLLLIGPVRIKYIALVLLFIDIIATRGQDNPGGHFAHIGGALAGFLFIYYQRKGVDISAPFRSVIEFFRNINQPKRKKTPRSTFKVYKSASVKSDTQSRPSSPPPEGSELDRILDKINDKGFNSLTAEEKEFLDRSSKK